MNNILYVDLEGVYKLIDYNTGHSELLLRMREKKGHFNIDIIFKSIRFISIPIELKGIEISIINDLEQINLLKDRFGFVTDLGYKVYELKNFKKEKFYLNGGVFGVFKNKLDILKSSLGDYIWSEQNKLIYWSEDVQC